ncbi:enoyl-CoA hydratase-related protein [Oceanimonas sp. CHS3-5]|uniref:enoyl-CoA hydratase-related protein n=1 Tax=Oceanimonas sp. CHS3-5 TaxID=3068186 RepID=UPI00273EF095|nr:enoyl-CoA hydratase-related protein [Oceanimonas sp. CHS3-5]MDP5292183.1 enoyl-CoA hydratase-related protein [Oceanimonas sp. CHS3-5]
MTDPITLQPAGKGVWELVLNTPERRNVMNEATIEAFHQCLNEAEAKPGLRLLVLKAEGKHFCAGADLGWMLRAAELSQSQNRADAARLAELLWRLDRFAHPTLALVQGAAYGGALGLVCACDIVIAADNARFSLSETRLGLIPATISPYVLRVLGARQARRFMLSAEVIDAVRAERLGLVHEVTTQPLEQAAAAVIEALLRGGPNAQAAAKALIQDYAGQPVNRALVADSAHRLATLRITDEAREGLAAFLEKRTPDWENDPC